jgi:hypothetical protein
MSDAPSHGREGLNLVQTVEMHLYPGLEVVERGLIARDAPLIEKPFTAEDLAHSVRRLLTGASASQRAEPAQP